MPKKFVLVNLGCPKNLVDGEGMEQQLIDSGYAETDHVGRADAIIVNTCGFIESAKEESIKALLQLAAMKRPGQLLVAAGCLGERYAEDLIREMPQLDGVLGTRRWSEIVAFLDRAKTGEARCWIGNADGDATKVEKARRKASSASAYIKIADGCSVGCAFCAIPRIKGPHRSKPIEQVLDEARQLGEQGVREVVLIAQNSTAYGHDWGETDALARLLDRLAEDVPEIPWIRLMYAFPAHVTPRLIETIARNDRVVKYLDLPLQHADPAVLRAMRRPEEHPGDLIQRLRDAIPSIAIRSAFIVGYPGEREREFAKLLAFLQVAELARVGVFTYSLEEGTLAASLPGRVSKRKAEERYRKMMELQQGISLRNNHAFVGRTIDVLIEGMAETTQVDTGRKRDRRNSGNGRKPASEPVFVGRSYRDAPEVDGAVFVHGPAKIGEIVRVTITEAMEYDLVGKVMSSDTEE